MPDEKRNPREDEVEQVPQRHPDLDIDEEEGQRDPSRRDDSAIDDDEDDDMPTGERPPLEPDDRV